MSKFLIQYVPVRPAKKDETVDISGPVLLTGEKCAALLNRSKGKKRTLLREQKKKEK